MKKVKVVYTDYPSIDEIQAFIFFGYITKLVKPVAKMFSYWDMDDKEIEIEEITKEQIIEFCNNESYMQMPNVNEQEIKLEFDTGEIMHLLFEDESMLYCFE